MYIYIYTTIYIYVYTRSKTRSDLKTWGCSRHRWFVIHTGPDDKNLTNLTKIAIDWRYPPYNVGPPGYKLVCNPI